MEPTQQVLPLTAWKQAGRHFVTKQHDEGLHWALVSLSLILLESQALGPGWESVAGPWKEGLVPAEAVGQDSAAMWHIKASVVSGQPGGRRGGGGILEGPARSRQRALLRGCRTPCPSGTCHL